MGQVHKCKGAHVEVKAAACCAQVDVYDGTADFLRSLEMDQDALTKAIIGTIGDIDAYQLPDAKGYTAFMRHILGVTDAERQQRREQILGTTLKDFRWGARFLTQCSRAGSVPVLQGGHGT